MLIEVEKDFKENDVVSFKLTSGEELITRFHEMDGEKFVVRNPMVLIAGQQGLGMQPFMLSVKPEGKFALSPNQILCVKPTEEELAKQFLSQTTGLTL